MVQGRDLLAGTGLKGGKWMGRVLVETEEQQFRGLFSSKDEALDYAVKLALTYKS